MKLCKSAVYIAVAVLFALLSGCADLPLREAALTGDKIFDIQQQRYISLPELAEKLSRSPIILLGENHDRIEHHDAELRLIRQLEKTARLKSVALEMFDSASQPQLTAAQQKIRTLNENDENRIATWLHWDKKWDWKQYRRLIRYLAKSTMTIYGANLHRDEINTIMQGAYPLQGEKSTSQTVKNRLGKLIKQSHRLAADLEFVDVLVSIQQFKDRRMAEVLINYPQPILFIGGRHHVSKSIGIPLHLDDYRQPHYRVIIMTDDKSSVSAADADYRWEL
ncbi:ChaN family lipoprotein [Chelonobacter oris]|uniref:ChaN family lipoprotein n=1 Tax=Chelonobacter oris TaxID=505317 RepID=UPI00068F506F|nr:ChaN family lipoprotein [Chelonobacter oris]